MKKLCLGILATLCATIYADNNCNTYNNNSYRYSKSSHRYYNDYYQTPRRSYRKHRVVKKYYPPVQRRSYRSHNQHRGYYPPAKRRAYKSHSQTRGYYPQRSHVQKRHYKRPARYKRVYRNGVYVWIAIR